MIFWEITGFRAQSVLCPAVGALDGLVPALDARGPLLWSDGGLEGPVDCPVLDNVFLACPVSYSQARQVSGAHSGGFDALGSLDRRVDDVGLGLHQVVVGGSTAVHLQGGQFDAGVGFHGGEHVIGLVGDGVQGGPDDVIFVDTPGQSQHGTPGIEPDFIFADFSNIYDREYLTSYIQNLN